MVGLQAQASRRERERVIRSSPPTTSSTSTSSHSLLATAAAAAAAVLLFVVPSAFAADFVTPGSIDLQLQSPPSRAKGLARSRAAPSPSPPPPPSTIELLSGSVRVSDGDTVEITSELDGTKHKIRIWGIDAPETKQLCRDGSGQDYECGKKATERMRELLGEKATCEVKARDQYGRAVARCFPGIREPEKDLSEAEDAGLALVESGDAVAYRQFSKGFYEPAEKVAKDQKVGIWGGEFEVPEDWRREQRIKTLQNIAAQRAPSPGGPLALAPKPSLPLLQTPTPLPSPSRSSSPASSPPPSTTATGEKDHKNCDIKGNVSSNNAKRYHLPGTAFYDAVKIDEAKGERFFCSEAEATAAGWEKARYGGRPAKEKAQSDDEGASAAPSTDAEVEAAADDDDEGGEN